MMAQQNLVYCQEMIDKGPIREFSTGLLIFAWVISYELGHSNSSTKNITIQKASL